MGLRTARVGVAWLIIDNRAIHSVATDLQTKSNRLAQQAQTQIGGAEAGVNEALGRLAEANTAPQQVAVSQAQAETAGATLIRPAGLSLARGRPDRLPGHARAQPGPAVIPSRACTRLLCCRSGRSAN